jgi:predicted GNAT superfamily acetyltransferase
MVGTAETTASVIARADAVVAADRAGVTLREVVDRAEFVAASALLAQVWGTSLEASPLQSDLLASLAHAGSCVLAAYAGPDLVGLTVGLAGSPCSRQIYSVIAATASEVAGRGVGAALKFGQRAWSLDRGAHRMVWTFDPLVRRNAHFNINKLRARASEYRMDFYPPMHDLINQQDLTDRLVVEWDLMNPVEHPVDIADAVALVGSDELHRPIRYEVGEARLVSVRVPDDIEQIRRTDQQLAREWRLVVRDALEPRLSHGYGIVRFSAEGAYILERFLDE